MRDVRKRAVGDGQGGGVPRLRPRHPPRPHPVPLLTRRPGGPQRHGNVPPPFPPSSLPFRKGVGWSCDFRAGCCEGGCCAGGALADAGPLTGSETDSPGLLRCFYGQASRLSPLPSPSSPLPPFMASRLRLPGATRRWAAATTAAAPCGPTTTRGEGPVVPSVVWRGLSWTGARA